MKNIAKNIEKILMESGVHESSISSLHRLYDNYKYCYISTEQFLKLVQRDWYHFGEMFEKDYDDHYVHAWAYNYKYIVSCWYKCMLEEQPAEISVGMLATVYYYSDHRAATVKSVEYYKTGKKDEVGNLIPKRIGVVLNPDVKCIDYYDGDYEVKPMTEEEVENAEVKYYFTLRKNGAGWVSEGDMTGDGLGLGVGYWSHYIDPSF